MTDRPTYHDLTLDQLLTALELSIADPRFSNAAIHLSIFKLRAGLVRNESERGTLSEAAIETHKRSIIDDVTNYTRDNNLPDFFATYGIVPIRRD